MRYALVGCGRMGRAVDRLAGERGHSRGVVVDPAVEECGCPSLGDADLSGIDVAFEFTLPTQAESNVEQLVRGGVPLVCCTTGWKPGPCLNELAR